MKENEALRKALYDRDGKKCHYCGISEKIFISIWGTFYGQDKRGHRLEIDHKNNMLGMSQDNCVLACALCNMAKSDKFTHEEFLKIGIVINEIWRSRKRTRARKS